MKRFIQLLELGSVIRYVIWKVTKGKTDITIKLIDGPHIRLRPFPAFTDYGVAYEVFMHRVYDDPGCLPKPH